MSYELLINSGLSNGLTIDDPKGRIPEDLESRIIAYKTKIDTYPDNPRFLELVEHCRGYEQIETKVNGAIAEFVFDRFIEEQKFDEVQYAEGNVGNQIETSGYRYRFSGNGRNIEIFNGDCIGGLSRIVGIKSKDKVHYLFVETKASKGSRYTTNTDKLDTAKKLLTPGEYPVSQLLVYSLDIFQRDLAGNEKVSEKRSPPGPRKPFNPVKYLQSNPTNLVLVISPVSNRISYAGQKVLSALKK